MNGLNILPLKIIDSANHYMTNPLKISIVGTVGVPANYGGFETLVENLVRYHDARVSKVNLTVYCSALNYSYRPSSYLSAKLRYIRLHANGISSVAYDIFSLLFAILHRSDVILLLGVSGAISLPFIRLISSARLVTNVDGIEWKRAKWNVIASRFLRFSEQMAVRYSHVVVADNGGIAEHLKELYGCNAHVIAYGGDHALTEQAKPFIGLSLSQPYALAVCRIEPENNVAMILEAFSSCPEMSLVFVGNWNNHPYAQNLRKSYAMFAHMHLIDPIYDVGVLRTLRGKATLYVHGHSAGGTNPSLVEMMHFGLPIFAYDCIFNRWTTKNSASFFKDVRSLRELLINLDVSDVNHIEIGSAMRQIALEHYTWEKVGRDYFKLLLDQNVNPS